MNDQIDSLTEGADDRRYEPPILTTLGTVGELTSANEDSIIKG